MRAVSGRLLAAVCYIYPPPVRDELMADMLIVFDRRLETVRTRHGRHAAVAFVARTLGSAFADAARQRFSSVGAGAASPVARSDSPGSTRARAAEAASRLIRSVHHGIRVWSQTPGHALVAVAALAIGIGVNIGVLALIGTLFFDRPPAHEPDELLAVVGRTARQRADYAAFTLDERELLAAQAESITGAAAYAPLWVLLEEGQATEELQAAKVDGGFFALLGMQPAAGRFFGPAEDLVPERDAVAVISFDLWRRRFAGNTDVVGATVRFNGTDFTVVGVAPEGFDGLFVEERYDIWIPRAMGAVDGWDERPYAPDVRAYDLLVRRDAEVDVEQVRAEIDGIVAGLRSGSDDERVGALVVPVRGAMPGTRSVIGRTPLLAMAVAGALLLLTCLNLAGLLLARNVGRRHEFATRRALGASNRSLLLQLLGEAAVLAAAAGVLAVGASLWTQRLLEQWYSYQLPGLRLRLDAWSLAAAFALVLLSAAALGSLPAWSACRRGIGGALRSRGAGASTGPGSSLLVVAQVALSLALITAAMVMLHSVEEILAAAGTRPESVVHYRLRPSRVGYDESSARAYQDRVLFDVEALPGIDSAALARVGPGAGWCCPVPVTRPGEADSAPLMVDNNHVTPNYFDTLRISILRGRGFRDADGPGSEPVAIVSEALALRLWPGQPALGRRLVAAEREYEVIGVAPDLLASRAGEASPPYLFLAYWQGDLIDARLYARETGGAGGLLQQVRRRVAAIDPRVHIGQEATLDERMRMSMASEQVLLGVLRTCALVALVLTALGLYGQLSLSVGRRQREIGVRMAIGASGGSVAMAEMRRGLRLVGAGIVLGVALAFAQARLLTAHVAGVSADDPSYLIVACAFLLAVGGFAAFLPARRAARVDPMQVLRGD